MELIFISQTEPMHKCMTVDFENSNGVIIFEIEIEFDLFFNYRKPFK